MNANPMMGAYIGIGIGVLFVLIMIIVIPRQIKKARQRGQQAADTIIKDFESRTGLKWNGQFFAGNYKGYNARVEKNIAYNKAKLVDGVSDILMNSKYKENMSGNTTVYPTLKIVLEKSDANFPDVTLFETGNFFLKNDEFWNNRLNGRIPEDSKLDINADAIHKKGTFYGSMEGAQRMLNSAELRAILPKWIYPDVRADKTKVTLELNNPGIIPVWGHSKTSGIDWMVEGLEICVATGNALS